MSAVIKSCLTEVSYNNTLKEAETEETVDSNTGKTQPLSTDMGNTGGRPPRPPMTIAEIVRENVCLNDCSNNGDCVIGKFDVINCKQYMTSVITCTAHDSLLL